MISEKKKMAGTCGKNGRLAKIVKIAHRAELAESPLKRDGKMSHESTYVLIFFFFWKNSRKLIKTKKKYMQKDGK